VPRLVSERLRRANRASIGGSTREKTQANPRIRPNLRTVPAYGFTGSDELGQRRMHLREARLELCRADEIRTLELAPQPALVQS
jgi:hypothetical protein